MLKWILIVVGGLILLVALVAVVGLFLPREHRAGCRVRLRAAPEVVHRLLTDVEGYARWRPDVRAVRRLEPRDGQAVFLEETAEGPRTYAVEREEPPRLLVLRIADDDLPYGGTWTFRTAPEGAGSTLTVTEDGFVSNPLFRALARFVFGNHATMERYLAALAGELGEEAPVERVE